MPVFLVESYLPGPNGLGLACDRIVETPVTTARGEP
jgi:hypothetical protein